MRVFPHFNDNGPPCPACKTREDKPTVLIPIPGTEKGGICEARQVHADCVAAVVAYSLRLEESSTNG